MREPRQVRRWAVLAEAIGDVDGAVMISAVVVFNALLGFSRDRPGAPSLSLTARRLFRIVHATQS